MVSVAGHQVALSLVEEFDHAAEGLAMNHDKKKAHLNVAAAARETAAVAQVPEHYTGNSVEGLMAWGSAHREQAEQDLFKQLVHTPSRALGF